MAAQQVFHIPLSSFLRLRFRAVFPVFFGHVWSIFEAISEMTCSVHIFKQLPFVMQMAVTLSISRKADACWTDRLKLWRCTVLTAVKDCNVNCLWWGVVLGLHWLDSTTLTHDLQIGTHTHTSCWFSRLCFSALHLQLNPPAHSVLPGLPTAQGTCSTSVYTAFPPPAPALLL